MDGLAPSIKYISPDHKFLPTMTRGLRSQSRFGWDNVTFICCCVFTTAQGE